MEFQRELSNAYILLYAHLYKYINTVFDTDNHQVLNSDENNYFNFKKNDSIANIKLIINKSEKNIEYNSYYVSIDKLYIYKGSESVSAFDVHDPPTTNNVYILKTPGILSFKTYLILLTNL
jgi:hypothetical protein